MFRAEKGEPHLARSKRKIARCCKDKDIKEKP
jgi:hypothetical protein